MALQLVYMHIQTQIMAKLILKVVTDCTQLNGHLSENGV